MADSATALRTIFTYPLSGVGPYPIAFDYLARKFVQVTLLGADRKLLVLGTNYRFSASRQITLIGTIPSGYDNIEIRRFTDAQDRLVDFQDGSILRASDLNISQLQTMHIAEEGRDVAGNTLGVDSDGNLDARNRKLVNLTDGVLDGDAVTVRQEKSWAQSTLSNSNAAAASAAQSDASMVAAQAAQAAAEAAKNAAQLSESNALSSKNSAATSATAAATSASQASTSATAAATSASQADTAKVAAQAAQAAAEAARDETLAVSPGNYVLKTNNLSDIPDKAAARTNLGAITSAQALSTVNADNLSGLVNKATSRANLGVPAGSTPQMVSVWVSFNGTTGAINGGFGVSSVVRNSAGNYTINFTTPLTTNYAPMAIAVAGSGAGAATGQCGILNGDLTKLTLVTFSSSFTQVDSAVVYLTIVGGRT